MSEVTLGWGQEETSVPGRREGRAAGGPQRPGAFFPSVLHFFLIFSFALNPFPHTHPTNAETDKAPNHQNDEVGEETDL